MTSLYKELKIWKRREADTAVLYRCFHDLTKGRFAVQSADFFKLPIDERQILDSEKQFLELLVEIAPSERCDWFSSIDEAIASHERDFS
jgi:hypothetical protein